MRKYTLITTFIVLSSALQLCFAQVRLVPKTPLIESSINTTVKGYFKAMDNNQWDAMMDYIHPGIFELIPKSEMKESMKKVFSDPLFNVDMHGYGIDKIGEPVKWKDTLFTKVHYHLTIDMQLKEKQKDPSSQKLFIETLLKFFKKSFGDQNVVFNASKNTISINTKKQFYAMQFPSQNNWYFLEKKKKLPMNVLAKIIPSEVQVKLD